MDTDEVELSFEDYKQQWMGEITEGSPSSVVKGSRFARKMIGDYFNLLDDEYLDDLVYCDGSGDGGIDIAYLERGTASEEIPALLPETETETRETGETDSTGATWFLVQSKYGTSFQGTATLFDEGRKILDTLDGSRTNLSLVMQDLQNRLVSFRQHAGKNDRIKLLFATEKGLTSANEKKALSDLQVLGQSRFGSLLEVQSISLEDIYGRVTPEDTAAKVCVALKGDLIQKRDMLAGLVSLPAMYNFLKNFDEKTGKTGSLDKLYEKNVRSYLGRRKKINDKMKDTLLNKPERFGLYNNGVTIVVSDFSRQKGQYVLSDPFVVNGCQTTSTLYLAFKEKADSGATGTPASKIQWYQDAEKGSVIVKIVKVSAQDADLLKAITRNTNSQNVISEKDFLALDPLLQKWVKEMKTHDIFLEIQKGSWDAQQAKQKKQLRGIRYTKEQYANAFELLKVYGAGWLGVPGTAWQQNKDFLPEGREYKKIIQTVQGEKDFGADDLIAASHLLKASREMGFGSRGKLEDRKDSRRITRFLFYFVVIHLIKEIGQLSLRHEITRAVLNLFEPKNEEIRNSLLEEAGNVIDYYLKPERSNSVFKESTYPSSKNLNTFMKSQNLGKSENNPLLDEHLRFAVGYLERHASAIKAALKG